MGLSAAVVLTGAGAGAYFLLGDDEASATTTTTRTVEVEKGTQTLTVSMDATLSALKESDVSFEVSGTVTKVRVDAGDTVKKGQILAVIDDTDLQNAVDLAEADVTTAKANRTDVYDDDDSSSAAKTSARAQVTSAYASLASAEEDLESATLRSPISGTVASVDLEVGDTVSSTSTDSETSHFVIIATSKWKVEGEIGAADLASVEAGQKAVVTTDGASGELTGTVTSTGIVATSTSDEGTATFPVEITLKGTHKNLFSGTTATAVITTGTYKNVISVPTLAITTQDGKTVVTKVTDGVNSTVEVEVGKVFGTSTQVTSGLSEADSVLITITRPSMPTDSGEEGEESSIFGGTTGGPPDGGMDSGGGPPAGASGARG